MSGALRFFAVLLAGTGDAILSFPRVPKMLDGVDGPILVFIILLGAAMLTASFRVFGGEELVKQFLEGLPGGF